LMGPTEIHGDTAALNSDCSSSVVVTEVLLSNSVIWTASALALEVSDVRLKLPAMTRRSNCTVRLVSAPEEMAICRVVASLPIASSLAK